MHDDVIPVLAGIGLIGIACQWLAWRVKLPAILFLLLAGIVAGPVTGWLNPLVTFGPLLLPIISLSVAVILFEGSLTLKFSDIQGLQTIVRRLVTTGMLTTWAIITVATHWLLGFSWKLSLLFGAITVVTGPTVVAPMLRTVRPTANIANILRWEGILIDPIGALLGVLVFQFIISKADSGILGQTLIIFARTLALSTLIGSLSGYCFGLLIRHHWLPKFLHNIFALTLVFGVFAAANEIQHESGLLAVTVMGVWLANMRGVRMDDILNFKESLSILLISGLFIILAASINVANFLELGWQAGGIFLIIQFVARPAKILLAAWGTGLNWRERALISWIAPRGIVAAATAAVFAARLQEHSSSADGTAHLVLTAAEYGQADLLVPLTFMVIVGTVVVQSTTSRLIALWLGVGAPEANGVLIFGANRFAREIAKALQDCGFKVLIADTNWGDIRTARMAGLKTFYGYVVSKHADTYLDLTGLGYLLALSEYSEVNLMACQHYRTEFGRRAIFSIKTEHAQAPEARIHFAPSAVGRSLFSNDTTLQKLQSLLLAGAKIHITVLTEQHDFDSFLKSHPLTAITLFAISPKGTLEFFAEGNEVSPKPDWRVISLVQPDSATP